MANCYSFHILCTAKWRAHHALYDNEAIYSSRDKHSVVDQVFEMEATDFQNADTVLAALHCTQIYRQMI